MTDSFYTPKILADKLVSYIDIDTQLSSVVDFCVGDGELLRAAESKWPSIQCYGSDISAEAVSVTKNRHSNWIISKFDFLNSNSRSNSKLIRAKKKFDLILLNPPFSCWGGTLNYSLINGESFSTSTSMKFVLEALQFLEKGGAFYAILPLSCAYSEKDKKAWKYLVDNYGLTILEESSIKYFKNCSPNIILVSINNRSFSKIISTRNKNNIDFIGVEVFRGKLCMHDVYKFTGDYSLIHTTNLQQNEIKNLTIKVSYDSALIVGPAVLLPRVGKPDFSKVCIVKTGDIYCLSDCVFALLCESEDLSLTLFSFFANTWNLFSKLYKGTGAHYITKNKIEEYLNLDKVKCMSDLISYV